jgi:hypothetical protein
MTAADATAFARAYADAIARLAKNATFPGRRRQSRHFDQALGAASPLRGGAARPRSGRARATRPRSRARRARGKHGHLHRRGGGRPAGTLARRDRGRRPRPRACRLGRLRHRGAGLFPARGPRRRLDAGAGRGARPPLHGPARQGRLLGHRNQARAGRGAGGFPRLHPQGGDGRLLPRLRAAGFSTRSTSTRSSPPTTPTPSPRSSRWRGWTGAASSSSVCTAWARRCTTW